VARHAIIELGFDDVAGMTAMTADPEYLERVRPDERLMSDPAALRFAMATREHVLSGGPDRDGLKIFDVLKRREGVGRDDFLAALTRAAREMADTPSCRRSLNRCVHNLTMAEEVGPFGAIPSHDVVVERWGADPDGVAAVLDVQRIHLSDLLDEAQSFSAIARQITVIDRAAGTPLGRAG
jgi:hypothetical protein